MSKQPIPAYNPKNDKHYDSWDALVEAEADGYLIILVHTTPSGKVDFANTSGGGYTKQQAQNKVRAYKRRLTKEGRVSEFKFFVRPAWTPAHEGTINE